jgi:hypothetical protein
MLRLGVFDRGDAEILPMAEDAGLREVRTVAGNPSRWSSASWRDTAVTSCCVPASNWNRSTCSGWLHRHRLLAAQSFKSTKLEYAYTVPQVFSPLGDLTVLGFFRQREETPSPADFGGSLGYLRLLPGIQRGGRTSRTNSSTRAMTTSTRTTDYGRPACRLVGVTFDRNRTDNPLDPGPDAPTPQRRWRPTPGAARTTADSNSEPVCTWG